MLEILQRHKRLRLNIGYAKGGEAVSAAGKNFLKTDRSFYAFVPNQAAYKSKR
ncbi:MULTISPECIES: hypothetical protein [Pasteurellaceae]|uniref:Uncharacterized protein n=1 Tax=Mannheimia succiniciproducens (strain KCTC 0769BP / MBEL55E) TaxID=221988 RepID=Q65R01_MANSM|nr:MULTISPECIES: hypothetical protein [Pasteurellaceae]AAU38609.1 unknown [[Mannheimia] succiniciproducens MBEL55E]WGE85339.1 hypothetical protein NYR87_09485 [Actinobacillus equuli subsp. haemolyticus]